MKTLLKAASAVLIIATAFVACEKDSIDSPNGDSNQPQKANANNKSLSAFEIYGSSHNSAMDYAATHANFDQLNNEQIFNHLQNYSDVNFDFSNGPNWLELEDGMLYTDALFSDLPNAANKLSEDGFIASDMVVLTQMFFDVFDDAVPSGGEPVMSVADFVANIEVFEDYVEANYTIVYDNNTKTGNLPALLLAASSVAKSSYTYWDGVGADIDDPWHGQNAERGGHTGHVEGGWFKRAWHSIKVAAVDVGGFFSCPYCGNTSNGNTYDIGLAWGYAGDQSAAY